MKFSDEELEGMTLTLQDAIDCGGCVSGVKELCRLYSKSFMDIARNGIPAKEAAKLDDAFINRVIAHRLGRD